MLHSVLYSVCVWLLYTHRCHIHTHVKEVCGVEALCVAEFAVECVYLAIIYTHTSNVGRIFLCVGRIFLCMNVGRIFLL